MTIRPTVVDGPFDTTERLTSWIDRLAASGPHLVPPDTGTAIQYIDARDLAAFMVLVATDGITGAFTVASTPTAFGQLLDDLGRVVRQAPRPGRLLALDPAKAHSAGLRTRPLLDTVRDTHAWSSARAEPAVGPGSRHGLTLARETQLAAQYVSPH